MPYGFAENRLKDGIKPETLRFQVITINQFFSFLDLKYPNQTLQIDQINSGHIYDFLKQQKDAKLNDSTVYRKQSTLRMFFDYLYRSKQVPFDPMEKLNIYENIPTSKVYKRSSEAPKLNYNYETLLDRKKHVVKTENLQLKSKLLYVFLLKGVQLADIFKLTTADFLKDKKNNSYTLYYTTKFKLEATTIFNDENDVLIIDQSIDLAELHNTPYLLHNQKKNGLYESTNALNNRFYFEKLQKEIDLNIRSENIRVAYVHYLHFKEGYSPYEISHLLGRPLRNIFKLIDESLQRIVNTNYSIVQEDRIFNGYTKEKVDDSEQLTFGL